MDFKEENISSSKWKKLSDFVLKEKKHVLRESLVQINDALYEEFDTAARWAMNRMNHLRFTRLKFNQEAYNRIEGERAKDREEAEKNLKSRGDPIGFSKYETNLLVDRKLINTILKNPTLSSTKEKSSESYIKRIKDFLKMKLKRQKTFEDVKVGVLHTTLEPSSDICGVLSLYKSHRNKIHRKSAKDLKKHKKVSSRKTQNKVVLKTMRRDPPVWDNRPSMEAIQKVWAINIPKKPTVFKKGVLSNRHSRPNQNSEGTKFIPFSPISSRRNISSNSGLFKKRVCLKRPLNIESKNCGISNKPSLLSPPSSLLVTSSRSFIKSQRVSVFNKVRSPKFLAISEKLGRHSILFRTRRSTRKNKEEIEDIIYEENQRKSLLRERPKKKERCEKDRLLCL
ncbi:unnamed protein product [Moneuplotes crassus]|uniref:Uncharacterized protein n=1 Tax=Euplotes crassus TaxID=5936 RepID=A0AAD1Y862_EUPCR|nr:unnamed protein product [Moneuplotes crassus]